MDLSTLTLLPLFLALADSQYTPDWPSLDSRPLPEWYDKAKVGVFMHWGPYAVPGVSGGVASEWFWAEWNGGNKEVVKYMKDFYPPDFTYQEFGSMFRAEFFNATQWAELVAASGAKYLVLTSKHHDGFTMWPSSRTFGWNSMDVGPKRDVVGELAEAVRAQGSVRFGLYHSLYEWYHPLYQQDKANNYTTRNFVEQKMGPELKELIEKYKPEVIWSDGDWDTTADYFDSLSFLSWLYSDSPVKDTIVANDRWGKGIPCHHGDFYTCFDRYNPGVLQPHKWENAMTIDKTSWGHRRNMQIEEVLTMDQLVKTLVETISCGGNLLMNVGPGSDGTIEPIFQERLRQMGGWLAVNGEAVYESRPWKVQNDTVNSSVWYTSKVTQKEGVVVYGHVLGWPQGGKVVLGSSQPGDNTQVTILGYNGGTLDWTLGEGKVGMKVQLPDRAQVTSEWGFVLKLVGLENAGNALWK